MFEISTYNFGNLNLIINIRIMQRTFGNPSNKAPTDFWIIRVRLGIYICVRLFTMPFFGTIRLILLLVMEIFLPTLLQLVVLMISVALLPFDSMNQSIASRIKINRTFLWSLKKFVVVGLVFHNMWLHL